MKNKLSLTLLFLFFSVSTILAADAGQGKEIFKTRCVSCHALDKVLVGPALKGATKKYELKWFTQFVRSSASLIAAGDEKAVKIFNEFNKIPMTEHKDLSDEQIAGIYAYIESESTETAVASDAAAINPTNILRLEDKKSTLRPIAGNTAWLVDSLWLVVCGAIIFFLLFLVWRNKNESNQ